MKYVLSSFFSCLIIGFMCIAHEEQFADMPSFEYQNPLAKCSRFELYQASLIAQKHHLKNVAKHPNQLLHIIQTLRMSKYNK